MAWYFRRYADDVPADKRPTYERAEADAREDHRGLWSQRNPLPQWEFRKPAAAPAVTSGPIVGNQRSMIYHLPTCPDYSKVSERKRVVLDTEDAAIQAAFRKALNCP